MGKVLRSAGKISKPNARFHAARHIATPNPKAITQHNRRVGEVVHAYNSAHASLFAVFLFLTPGVNFEYALDLWHSAGTDKSQRLLLEVKVRHELNDRKVLQKAMLWAIGAMHELGTFRNDAVHTNMLWHYDQMHTGIDVKNSTVKRLQDLPFDAHWKPLKGDLCALANYITGLATDVFSGDRLPSHRRPKLQLAQSVSAETQKRRRLAKRAERERQRSNVVSTASAAVTPSAL